MTREEFITDYMKRSGLNPSLRTEDGFHVPGTQRRYALPCKCGEDQCLGWAMVGEEFVQEHNDRNAE